jgi:hypothetical protein
MKILWKFSLVAIVLVVLVPLSSCRDETHQAAYPTSAPATNTRTSLIPTAEEVFHLHSECAGLGEKMLKKNKEGDTTESDHWFQSSHYSPETNRCYVEITSVTADRDSLHFQSYDVLYDGQTDEELASVLKTGKNCPNDPCKAVGITPGEHKICTACTSSEDAENYIRDKMHDPHD